MKAIRGFVRRWPALAAVGAVVAVAIGILRKGPRHCTGLDPYPGCHTNPWQCEQATVTVFGPSGPATYPECGSGPSTVVRSDRGLPGLDVAARAELRFAPTNAVSVRVVHFATPGRVEAYDTVGTLVVMRPMSAPAGLPEDMTFQGAQLERIVVVAASPTDETRLLQFCH